MASPLLPAPALDAPARAWVPVLARYRDPDHARTWYEITVTLIPYAALWALALVALSYSYWLTFAVSIPLGFLLMRIFVIQHDCGHGGPFKVAHLNDRVGRCFGVLTLTPYTMWRKMHANHHANLGNLDQRGIGEVYTMTVAEYRAKPPLRRFLYRIYRNPFFLLVIGPFWLFFIQHRVPFGMWTMDRKYWVSAMGTNLAIAAVLAVLYAFDGWAPILLIWMPSTFLGALAGVWTFYVQHQFEEAQLDWAEDWKIHHASLHSSSQYILPQWLHWCTANMGIHHVHHLYAKIPFYRLPEVIRDYPELRDAQQMTIRESLKCIHMQLWDEDARRMISFKQEQRLGVALGSEEI